MKYISLLLVILSIYQKIDAAALHAILVIDTNAEDIRLAMIGNYLKWQSQLSEISLCSDLKLINYVFKDEKADSNFIDELKSLKVGSDDVIIFYWSGHGCRTCLKDNSENPWPNFYFNKDNTAFDFKRVTEFFMDKNPRLLISIADTCNHYVPWLFSPKLKEFDSHMSFRKGESQTLKANYTHLFRDFSGVIMCAGSHPGQYSWAYVPIGCIFTLSFLEALKTKAAGTSPTDWESIFEKSLSNLQDYDPPEEQIPLIDIQLN